MVPALQPMDGAHGQRRHRARHHGLRPSPRRRGGAAARGGRAAGATRHRRAGGDCRYAGRRLGGGALRRGRRGAAGRRMPGARRVADRGAPARCGGGVRAGAAGSPPHRRSLCAPARGARGALRRWRGAPSRSGAGRGGGAALAAAAGAVALGAPALRRADRDAGSDRRRGRRPARDALPGVGRGSAGGAAPHARLPSRRWRSDGCGDRHGATQP